MSAYYNEIDPKAVAWLHELMKAGVIADGLIDDRSIVDVQPEDLADFTQCHFFAGIGVWSYALRQAGWSDDRPVWTGSCPCQPFSNSGKKKGFSDDRHLWPYWGALIALGRPPVVFGEQVAAALDWDDLVQGDLEAEGYARASVIVGAHSVGAPHIRQRLYWVADDPDQRQLGRRAGEAGSESKQFERSCAAGQLGNNNNNSRQQGRHGPELRECADQLVAGKASASGRLHNANCQRDGALQGLCEGANTDRTRNVPAGVMGQSDSQRIVPSVPRTAFRRLSENRFESVGAGPLGGFWSDAEWLGCADDKLRPVEPGTFPLAHGAPARVGRLRGYGNAIVAPLAQAFIETYMSLGR